MMNLPFQNPPTISATQYYNDSKWLIAAISSQKFPIIRVLFLKALYLVLKPLKLVASLTIFQIYKIKKERKKNNKILYQNLCPTLNRFNVKAILFIHSRSCGTFTHNVIDGVVRYILQSFLLTPKYRFS